MLVGVLGGGQLGRMLALAGIPLNLRFVFVDPDRDAPSAVLGEHLALDYADPAVFERLARSDVVTCELESIPISVVQALEARVRVEPGSKAIAAAQDRLAEKTCFLELGIPTAEFVAVDSLAELEAALSQLGMPAVLKTRRFGYDGRGQIVIQSLGQAPAAFSELARSEHPQTDFRANLILERFVRFSRELSLLSVRSRSFGTRFYDLVENQHDGGILRKTLAPAPALDAGLQAMAEDYAERLLTRLDYAGVLALELFEVEGRLLANEMAPRVHNSGHFSIEGARTSQFENHLRAVLGWPLGDTATLGPAAMLNLIGTLPDTERVLAVPDTHLHLYGKEPRPGRKLGHVTVRAPDETSLQHRLDQLAKLVHPNPPC